MHLALFVGIWGLCFAPTLQNLRKIYVFGLEPSKRRKTNVWGKQNKAPAAGHLGGTELIINTKHKKTFFAEKQAPAAGHLGGTELIINKL